MPGYAFQVTMTMTNPTTTEQIISIPRGTIIEPESTHLTAQSAVIAKDYIFKLNPKETRSVLLEAECWNQHLSPPRGVPGKMTPLKGNVQKTTNVWGVSSAPSKTTLSTKPSQPHNVFAAFANTSPEFAYHFLSEIVSEAEARGVDVTVVSSELATISSPDKSVDKLVSIAKDDSMRDFINAGKIREFFIKRGNPTDDHIDAVEQLVTNVYALNSHRLASRLYDLAMELAELSEDKKIAVTPERSGELKQLMRQKYTTLLDSLPLLDQVEWSA
jgi:hypothetical protein